MPGLPLTTADPNHQPVSLMKFAVRLLGKGDVADRLFGLLQVDSSKVQQLLDLGPVITMNDQLGKSLNWGKDAKALLLYNPLKTARRR